MTLSLLGGAGPSFPVRMGRAWFYRVSSFWNLPSQSRVGSSRLNLRASNTEPFLRLNAEAVDATTMADIRDDVLALVRQ